MITISFEDNLIIPKQSDWLNKDYTERWNNEIEPLYLLCVTKCKVLEACERYNKILCTKFETPDGDIIEFYPHWEHYELNGESFSRIDLIKKLS